MRLARSSKTYVLLRAARSRAVIVLKGLRLVDPTAYVHPVNDVARDLVAGRYAYIGRNCTIPPLVNIGAFTMLAPHVAIVGDDHIWNVPGKPVQFSGRPPQRATTIEADVWVGRGVIIMKGVTVGRGAILGAGAIVTGDIPPYEIWAGVPAKRIGKRFDTEVERSQHDDMLGDPYIRPLFVEPFLGESRQ